MPIPILCPCSAKLRVADDLDGERVQCPKCQAVHSVVNDPDDPLTRSALFALPSDPDEILEAAGFSEQERTELEERLQPGETLLWAKKPVIGSVFKWHLITSNAFHFHGLALLLVLFLAWDKFGGLGMIPVILLMVLSFAAGVAWPFFQRARWAKAAYAVTDRRILVWTRNFLLKPKFMAYEPSDLARLRRLSFSAKPEAVGHIFFGAERWTVFGFKTRFFIIHAISHVDNLVWLEKLIRETHVDAYTDRLYA